MILFGGFGMRIRKMVLLGAALVAVALSGCTANGGYKAYKSSPGDAPIKSIVLLTPMNPDHYVIIEQGTASGQLGMAGALAAMQGDGSKEAQMNTFLKNGGFDFGPQFTQRLQKKLADAGYSVSIIAVERSKPMGMAKVPAEAAQADAVIDTAIWHVGYGNVSIIDPAYRPAIKVDVRMTRGANKVYGETLMYGYHNHFMAGTDLDAPGSYFFNGYAALLHDPAKLREGLDIGMDMIVSHVAARLAGDQRVAGR
jgi:hypothetical protein